MSFLKYLLALVGFLIIIGSVFFVVSKQTKITPTPTPSPQPPITPAYMISLVALEGSHEETETIGCNDALVPIFRESSSSSLTIALNELLSTSEKTVTSDNVELYNSLAQSDLTIEKTEIKDGVASINLQGQLRLAGACDAPRVEEQLKATALQFPEIKEVKIFVNGQPLAEALSQK